MFKELGGDQTIITYMYNFYNADKSVNTDETKLNKFNFAIYQKFSFTPTDTDIHDTELVVTASAFTRNVYGDLLMDNLRKRLGLTGSYKTDESLNFIISTIMNPWLSNTIKGSFIPQIMNIIIKNVTKIIPTIK